MTLFSLAIRGRVFSAANLTAPVELPHATDNERNALAFCAEWLSAAERFVVNTSGSTGAPKAIALSRTQMQASARATADALGLRAGMRTLVCLPVHAIAGRMMLVRAMELGLATTLVEPASNPLASLPAHSTFDFAAFVPLQMQTLLAGPERAQIDAMHAVLVGGAPVSAALAEAIALLQAAVYHTYGMTETATHIALRRLSGPGRSDAFAPLPGVELRLDARGCLALRGPMTNDDWVQTNDLVQLRPDGTFLWLGRADLVINSGGIKVHVEPLEARLEALLPALLGSAWDGRRYAVVGLPDAHLGEAVALILEGEPLPESTARALLAGLRGHLGPYETPRTLQNVAHFVETSTGKIDRAATRALFPAAPTQ